MRTDETATARYLSRGDVTKLRLISTARERHKFIFVTVALYIKIIIIIIMVIFKCYFSGELIALS